MDTDTDILTEDGLPNAGSHVLEEIQGNSNPLPSSDPESMMDLLVGLKMVVRDLYTSEFFGDLEVRLCCWLMCCLVVLWLCIIVAWKTYGPEIMTVLNAQDKLNRSGSVSRGSSRQNSSDDASVVTDPPVSRSETWQEHGRLIEASVSAPHHPKAD